MIKLIDLLLEDKDYRMRIPSEEEKRQFEKETGIDGDQLEKEVEESWFDIFDIKAEFHGIDDPTLYEIALQKGNQHILDSLMNFTRGEIQTTLGIIEQQPFFQGKTSNLDDNFVKEWTNEVFAIEEEILVDYYPETFIEFLDANLVPSELEKYGYDKIFQYLEKNGWQFSFKDNGEILATNKEKRIEIDPDGGYGREMMEVLGLDNFLERVVSESAGSSVINELIQYMNKK